MGSRTSQKRKRSSSSEVATSHPKSLLRTLLTGTSSKLKRGMNRNSEPSFFSESITPTSISPSTPLIETNLQEHVSTSMAASVVSSKDSRIYVTTIADVRWVLHYNDMFIEDDEAYIRYPELKITVDTLVHAGRGPGDEMKLRLREKIHKTCREYATANGLTFLIEVWKLLVHDNRDVMMGSATDDSVTNKVVWIERKWENDGLRLNWQTNFARTALLTLVAPNSRDAKLLESLPQVQVPKPDLTYGLRMAEFDAEDRLTQDTLGQYVTQSRELCHAFFVIKAKGFDEGTIEDAENECCRAGAALVHARRKLNLEACRDDGLPLGADLESFVFSLAIVPSAAHMFVHWAETRNILSEEGSKIVNALGLKTVSYHMNLVESYDFRARKGNAFPLFKRNIENILDWGILGRQEAIQDALIHIKCDRKIERLIGLAAAYSTSEKTRRPRASTPAPQ